MAPALAPGVSSEVARLRVVLVHRPGGELSRLTPSNNAGLLFDGVPWVQRAQEEHDHFTATLRGQGVEVLLLGELLEETLHDEQARYSTIEQATYSMHLGPGQNHSLHHYLLELDPQQLATTLITGMTLAEASGKLGNGIEKNLTHVLSDPHHFLIHPLPNLMFTRDSSMWIGTSVLLPHPATAARAREHSLLRAIYAHHPRFAGTHLLEPGGPIEGGDILHLGHGALAAGLGQRTTSAGAESLASTLFSQQLATAVVAVPIPQERAMMHLDTVLTLVDERTLLGYPNLAPSLHGWVLRPDTAPEGPLPLLEAFAQASGQPGWNWLPLGEIDPTTAEREQWDDGYNCLALRPRQVITYERNVVTNAALARAGVGVNALSGSEMGSGRGGPHCLSCPITRRC